MDIDKLKALALALSGAKWNEPTEQYTDAGMRYREITTEDGDVVIGECGPSEDEAQFIAASCPATVLELIAEVEKLQARFEYIEEHATTHGGGHGFTVSFFVPVDCEDIGCGIDAAIEKEKV